MDKPKQPQTPLTLAGVRYHVENIASYAQRAVFYTDAAYEDEVKKSQDLLVSEFDRIQSDHYKSLMSVIELEREVMRLKGMLSK